MAVSIKMSSFHFIHTTTLLSLLPSVKRLAFLTPKSLVGTAGETKFPECQLKIREMHNCSYSHMFRRVLAVKRLFKASALENIKAKMKNLRITNLIVN